MNIDKAIKNYKNCKSFKDKKPDWRDIITAIDATRYAPTAGDLFTLKFVVVDNPEKIQAITDCTQQAFVSQAHYLVVVCSDPKRLYNSYGKELGNTCNKHQTGAAIQNFLLKLEELGLATCWIKLFHEEGVKRVLFIPDNITVEAIFPIGYEYKKPRTREAKIDLDPILFFNKYKNKKMNPPRKNIEGY